VAEKDCTAKAGQVRGIWHLLVWEQNVERMGAQEEEVLMWDGCSSCLKAELVPVTELEMWQGYLFVDYVVTVGNCPMN